MDLPIYQVDAFANRLFTGNPAAVCPLQGWLNDWQMQAIAAENNLAETAFFVPQGKGFEIRWFTPEVEVDLCGHATLAAAHILFTELRFTEDVIEFHSRSGLLTVARDQHRLSMDFPAEPALATQMPPKMVGALGAVPSEILFNQDYLCVFDDEAIVRDMQPDFAELSHLDTRGIIVTAAAENYDFICRFFAPQVGINEDPVTGSAFTKLAPYWARRLGKRQLVAQQASHRGGDVWCEIDESNQERVVISGSAVTFMHGTMNLGGLINAGAA